MPRCGCELVMTSSSRQLDFLANARGRVAQDDYDRAYIRLVERVEHVLQDGLAGERSDQLRRLTKSCSQARRQDNRRCP